MDERAVHNFYLPSANDPSVGVWPDLRERVIHVLNPGRPEWVSLSAFPGDLLPRHERLKPRIEY